MAKHSSKAWKKSAEYGHWIQIVKAAEEFPLDRYEEELMNRHSQRPSRKLYVKKRVRAHKIVEAAAYDADLRSRATEVMLFGRKINSTLETANEAFQDFIHDQKWAVGSTQAERKSSAAEYARRGLTVEAALDGYESRIRDLLNDIDQSYWQMKNILNAIEISSKPEARL